jgi:hypothetical protein
VLICFKFGNDLSLIGPYIKYVSGSSNVGSMDYVGNS